MRVVGIGARWVWENRYSARSASEFPGPEKEEEEEPFLVRSSQE